jgi:hypothetical protein
MNRYPGSGQGRELERRTNGMITIRVCMIVKDEEEVLARCLFEYQGGSG